MTAMPPTKFDPLHFCFLHRVSTEARQEWIATAAYYKAEHRGFAPGHEAEDWREAEREIARAIPDSI